MDLNVDLNQNAVMHNKKGRTGAPLTPIPNMVTLADIDAYPGPELLIPRIVKEHGYTQDYAEKAFREAKRMIYLRHLSKEGVSPSKKIDMAWHEMLMFTKFYQEFCEFAGGFVHHNPAPGPPDGGRLYAKTKENYEKFLHEKPDPELWA